MNKEYFRKTGEELQDYFRFRKKQGIVPAKKGKGSFKRKDKHRKRGEGQ